MASGCVKFDNQNEIKPLQSFPLYLIYDYHYNYIIIAINSRFIYNLLTQFLYPSPFRRYTLDWTSGSSEQ